MELTILDVRKWHSRQRQGFNWENLSDYLNDHMINGTICTIGMLNLQKELQATLNVK
jgi:virulence-associated protein VapD